MKISLKRIVALIMAILLAVSLMAGCAGDSTSSEPEESKQESVEESSSADSESNEEDEAWKEVSAKVDIPEIFQKDPEHLEWMDDTSPVEISVYYSGTVSDEEFTWNTAVEQWITELTGVTVKGQTSADSDGNELTLMIAGGEKLPDIITNVASSSVHFSDLVSGDALYKINDLIDEYCPTMWELIDPYVKAVAEDDNGDMWYLPKRATTGAMEPYYIANGWFAVRGDVCDDMGIDPNSIKTLADMEKVIDYYMENKANYPEIKYPIWASTLGGANGAPFYNCFGGGLPYDSGLGMVYDVDNDSVSFWIEDEKGYNALKYMWQLVQKGYMTEATFDYTGTYDEMTAGSVLFACGENMWPAGFVTNALQENVEGAYYSRIGMLSADESIDAYYSSVSYSAGLSTVIVTKDCENPERTIKFLEFLQSEYGSATVFCGVYGEDWETETDDSGKVVGKYIGEAVTAEGRSARGVNNYLYDLLNGSSNFDFFNTYISSDPEQAYGASFARFSTYVAAPATVMNNEPADSENARIREQLNEIMKNYQTQMILAKDESTFEQLYNECIDVLNQNKLDELKDYVLGLTHDYISTSEGYGIKFQ